MSDKGRDWLAYWERASAQKAFMCFVDGCINMPSVGGLVRKEGASDGKCYVIPLCGECSTLKASELEIWDMARLVPASDSETPVRRPCALPHGNARYAGSILLP